MYQKQTQTEWENEMSVKVIDLIRSELYLDLRYLGVALSALVPKGDGWRLSVLFIRTGFTRISKQSQIFNTCVPAQYPALYFFTFVAGRQT